MHSNFQSTRALLIIDDAKLRREKFAFAARVLKKMTRLEGAMQSFDAADRELYQHWYELNFREEQRQLGKLREEYQVLASFRRLVEVVSLLQGVSLLSAYRIIKEEEERYRTGNPEERARIEAERANRLKQLRQRIEKQEREEFESARAKESEEDFTQGGRNWLDELRTLDDEMLRQKFAEASEAAAQLTKIYGLAFTPDDYRLLLRIWDLLTPEVQAAVAEELEGDMGIPWVEVIKAIRREANESNAGSPGAAGEENRRLSPPEEENFRLLYRKLVRRLHPDMQGTDGKLVPWEKITWQKAQDAYRARNFKTLDRLYKVTLIRQGELAGLTLDEIVRSSSWLEEEFRYLELQARPLKKLPWWRFAKRKSHGPLSRKLRRKLEDEALRLELAIDGLRQEHELLEAMSKEKPKRKRKRDGDG